MMLGYDLLSMDAHPKLALRKTLPRRPAFTIDPLWLGQWTVSTSSYSVLRRVLEPALRAR